MRKVCRNCVFWVNGMCQARANSTINPETFTCELFTPKKWREEIER